MVAPFGASRRVGTGLALGLLVLFASPGQGANYPGGYGQPPAGSWQYPNPSPGTTWPGSPGGAQRPWGEQAPAPWGGYPGGGQPGWGGQSYPGWGQGQYPQYPSGGQTQRQAQPQAEPPRVEVEIGNRQPYLQESLLLTLRLISTASLETANPELPQSNDLLFQKVQGPTARSRTGAQGRQEILNEFVYAVTPLRVGNLEIPPIRVLGNQATSYGGRVAYDVSSAAALPIQVRPAMPSVQPWLPLAQLSLKATLDRPEKAEEGQPVTLVLQLDALGTSGAQLPSLEAELQAGDFRVYREQTITDTKLSADASHLVGTRTEFYTLVPRSGGKLRLPEIRIPWWNVRSGTKETASLPIKTLQVAGESGPFGLPLGAGVLSAGAAGFWLPILGLLLLVSGYWIGVWYKGRRMAGRQPLPPWLQARLGSLGEDLREGTRSALRRLAPRRWWRRLTPRLGALLPGPLRFWMCLRQVEEEPDPAAWSGKVQRLSCQRLRVSDRAALPAMTERMIALYPRANPEKLHALMAELDGALYGKKPLDFPRWKAELHQQVRPRLVSSGLFRLGRWYRRARLPELNPRQEAPSQA